MNELPKTFAEAAARLDLPKPVAPVRVAVCIPCKGEPPVETMLAVSTLCSYSMQKRMATIALTTTDKNPIASARNLLAKQAMEFGAEYILWIDADMQFPPDALNRLLAHRKDVVGTFYNTRIPPYTTVGNFLGPAPDPSKGGVHPAEIMGFGLVLTHTRVFRENKLPWPWFQHQWGVKERIKPENEFGEIGEDVFFCENARRAGYEIFVDLDLTFDPMMGHVTKHIIRIGKPQKGDEK